MPKRGVLEGWLETDHRSTDCRQHVTLCPAPSRCTVLALSASLEYSSPTVERMLMDTNLSSHHRATLGRIFSHPASGNIPWRGVLSLLDAVGTVTEQHNGKLSVAVGPETEIFEAPREKDIDEQLIVDLRRMLKQAGFSPDGALATTDGRHRDHGDGQWGAPT